MSFAQVSTEKMPVQNSSVPPVDGWMSYSCRGGETSVSVDDWIGDTPR